MKTNFLKDSLVYFVFRLISALGWLLSLILLPKMLGPQNYGIFILIYSSIIIFSSLLTTWISSSILRFYNINDFILFSNYINNSLLIVLSFNILLFGLLFVLFSTINFNFFGDFRSLQYYIITWFVLFNIYNSLINFYRASRKVVFFGFVNNIQIIGSLLVFILISNYVNEKLFCLIISYISIYVFSILILVTNLIKSYKIDFINLKNMNQTILLYLKYGIPLCLLGVFSQGISTCDRFFISHYWGNYKTGIYSATYSISEQLIFLVVSIFTTVSTPILYEMWSKKDEIFKISKYLNEIKKIYQIITLPILVLLYCFRIELVDVVYGKSYIYSALIIPFVSIGAYFVGLSTLYTDILTSTYRSYKLMFCYLIVVTCNFILNYLLIPWNLFYGASISTMITGIIMYFTIHTFTRKIVPWKIHLFNNYKIVFSNLILLVLIIAMKLLNFKFESALLKPVLISIIGIITYIYSLTFCKIINLNFLIKFIRIKK